LEARERCSDMKKIYTWDLVITVEYWCIQLSMNINGFDNIELPAAVVAWQCIEMVKLW
jgi:hypothetical protein